MFIHVLRRAHENLAVDLFDDEDLTKGLSMDEESYSLCRLCCTCHTFERGTRLEASFSHWVSR